MIDNVTGRPFSVYGDSENGHFVMVDNTQADAVEQALREHRFFGGREHGTIRTTSGDMGIDTFNFGRIADLTLIQRVLADIEDQDEVADGAYRPTETVVLRF